MIEVGAQEISEQDMVEAIHGHSGNGGSDDCRAQREEVHPHLRD